VTADAVVAVSGLTPTAQPEPPPDPAFVDGDDTGYDTYDTALVPVAVPVAVPVVELVDGDDSGYDTAPESRRTEVDTLAAEPKKKRRRKADFEEPWIHFMKGLPAGWEVGQARTIEFAEMWRGKKFWCGQVLCMVRSGIKMLWFGDPKGETTSQLIPRHQNLTWSVFYGDPMDLPLHLRGFH
jgi:hypothetical protein